MTSRVKKPDTPRAGVKAERVFAGSQAALGSNKAAGEYLGRAQADAKLQSPSAQLRQILSAFPAAVGPNLIAAERRAVGERKTLDRLAAFAQFHLDAARAGRARIDLDLFGVETGRVRGKVS